jgi:hypothetical protein
MARGLAWRIAAVEQAGAHLGFPTWHTCEAPLASGRPGPGHSWTHRWGDHRRVRLGLKRTHLKLAMAVSGIRARSAVSLGLWQRDPIRHRERLRPWLTGVHARPDRAQSIQYGTACDRLLAARWQSPGL